jgi:hypothetical protein
MSSCGSSSATNTSTTTPRPSSGLACPSRSKIRTGGGYLISTL